MVSPRSQANPSAHPALALFRELLAIPSPSGREDRMAEAIRGKLAGWGYEPETDAAGNVLVRVAGRDAARPLCVLASHMDEIGMTVTAVEADGSLRVIASGSLYPWKLGEGPVEVLGDKGAAAGILSMGSTHTADAGERRVGWDGVRILTGLSPAEVRERGVRPGSPAVPAAAVRGPVLLGDGDDPLVAAWTFDDRMGIVALLRALDTLRNEALEPPGPTIFAFTVHEESGGDGAKILAQRERPEVFVAVDGCPVVPGAPLALDGRPGIWTRDRLVHYDHRLIRELRAAAAAAGTELQPAVYESTFSDASAVWTVGAAPRVACFGHVRDNSHGYEVARLAVFDRVLDTLVSFLRGAGQA